MAREFITDWVEVFSDISTLPPPQHLVVAIHVWWEDEHGKILYEEVVREPIAFVAKTSFRYSRCRLRSGKSDHAKTSMRLDDKGDWERESDDTEYSLVFLDPELGLVDVCQYSSISTPQERIKICNRADIAAFFGECKKSMPDSSVERNPPPTLPST